MRNLARLTTAGLTALLVLLPGCAGTQGGGSDAANEDPNRVVAVANGEDVTWAELKDEAQGGLRKLEQDRYDLLRQELDRMALDRAIAQEAASRGVTSDELKKIEIDDKLVEPTDADIRAFYERNKRVAGNRKLEDLASMIRAQLVKERRSTLERVFYDEMRKHAQLEVRLEPPRFDVPLTGEESSRGNADAPITVVEYGDFQCPYCRREHAVIDRVLADYKDQVRFIFRDFPLEIHARAVPASVAAQCAREQDRFWPYYDNLMMMGGDLSDKDLRDRARSLELDMTAFESCMTSGRYDESFNANLDEGRDLGVTSTPTFFINGRMLVGAKPIEVWKGVLDEELGGVEQDQTKGES